MWMCVYILTPPSVCVCLRHVDGCSEAVAEAASSHRYLILEGFVM